MTLEQDLVAANQLTEAEIRRLNMTEAELRENFKDVFKATNETMMGLNKRLSIYGSWSQVVSDVQEAVHGLNREVVDVKEAKTAILKVLRESLERNFKDYVVSDIIKQLTPTMEEVGVPDKVNLGPDNTDVFEPAKVNDVEDDDDGIVKEDSFFEDVDSASILEDALSGGSWIGPVNLTDSEDVYMNALERRFSAVSFIGRVKHGDYSAAFFLIYKGGDADNVITVMTPKGRTETLISSTKPGFDRALMSLKRTIVKAFMGAREVKIVKTTPVDKEVQRLLDKHVEESVGTPAPVDIGPSDTTSFAPKSSKDIEDDDVEEGEAFFIEGAESFDESNPPLMLFEMGGYDRAARRRSVELDNPMAQKRAEVEVERSGAPGQFRMKKYNLKMADGTIVQTEGETDGIWGVEHAGRGYFLSHVPSGIGIGGILSIADVKQVIKILNSVTDWSRIRKASDVPPNTLSKVADHVAMYLSRSVKAPQRKVVGKGPAPEAAPAQAKPARKPKPQKKINPQVLAGVVEMSDPKMLKAGHDAWPRTKTGKLKAKLNGAFSKKVIVAWLKGGLFKRDHQATNDVWISYNKENRVTFKRSTLVWESGGRGSWERDYDMMPYGEAVGLIEFAAAILQVALRNIRESALGLVGYCLNLNEAVDVPVEVSLDVINNHSDELQKARLYEKAAASIAGKYTKERWKVLAINRLGRYSQDGKWPKNIARYSRRDQAWMLFADSLEALLMRSLAAANKKTAPIKLATFDGKAPKYLYDKDPGRFSPGNLWVRGHEPGKEAEAEAKIQKTRFYKTLVKAGCKPDVSSLLLTFDYPDRQMCEKIRDDFDDAYWGLFLDWYHKLPGKSRVESEDSSSVDLSEAEKAYLSDDKKRLYLPRKSFGLVYDAVKRLAKINLELDVRPMTRNALASFERNLRNHGSVDIVDAAKVYKGLEGVKGKGAKDAELVHTALYGVFEVGLKEEVDLAEAYGTRKSFKGLRGSFSRATLEAFKSSSFAPFNNTTGLSRSVLLSVLNHWIEEGSEFVTPHIIGDLASKEAAPILANFLKDVKKAAGPHLYISYGHSDSSGWSKLSAPNSYAVQMRIALKPEARDKGFSVSLRSMARMVEVLASRAGVEVKAEILDDKVYFDVNAIPGIKGYGRFAEAFKKWWRAKRATEMGLGESIEETVPEEYQKALEVCEAYRAMTQEERESLTVQAMRGYLEAHDIVYSDAADYADALEADDEDDEAEACEEAASSAEALAFADPKGWIERSAYLQAFFKGMNPIVADCWRKVIEDAFYAKSRSPKNLKASIKSALYSRLAEIETLIASTKYVKRRDGHCSMKSVIFEEARVAFECHFNEGVQGWSVLNKITKAMNRKGYNVRLSGSEKAASPEGFSVSLLPRFSEVVKDLARANVVINKALEAGLAESVDVPDKVILGPDNTDVFEPAKVNDVEDDDDGIVKEDSEEFGERTMSVKAKKPTAKGRKAARHLSRGGNKAAQRRGRRKALRIKKRGGTRALAKKKMQDDKKAGKGAGKSLKDYKRKLAKQAALAKSRRNNFKRVKVYSEDRTTRSMVVEYLDAVEPFLDLPAGELSEAEIKECQFLVSESLTLLHAETKSEIIEAAEAEPGTLSQMYEVAEEALDEFNKAD